MIPIYLGIGSNISPRQFYISESLRLLKNCFPSGFCYSSIYATKPFHRAVQTDYLNCCVHFLSDKDLSYIHEKTIEIEHQLGRKRSNKKWQSRTIDIDILLAGQQIIDTTDLQIPHYDLTNRDFFLIPLLEISGNLTHPVTKIPLKESLEGIPDDLLTNPVILK